MAINTSSNNTKTTLLSRKESTMKTSLVHIAFPNGTIPMCELSESLWTSPSRLTSASVFITNNSYKSWTLYSERESQWRAENSLGRCWQGQKNHKVLSKNITKRNVHYIRRGARFRFSCFVRGCSYDPKQTCVKVYLFIWDKMQFTHLLWLNERAPTS